MRYLALPATTSLGGKVVVKLRPAGTTAWSAATLIDMGRQTLVDTSTLNAALTYDFEILHYRRDDITGQLEPLHYASATGQFGVGGQGWLRSTQAPASTDSVRHEPVIEQSLDRWGNVIGVSRPGDASAITRTRYDGLNNVLQQTAMPVDVWGEDGIATRSTPVTRQYYDLLGRLLGDTDANGNTESRRYDAAGNVIAQAHADGGTVIHTHDLLGRKTSTTDAAGKTTRYTWDRMDRLISEQRPIGTDYYEYDQAGNRIRESGARVTLTHWYDTRGRLILTRDALGGYTGIDYDKFGNKVGEYNANGDSAVWQYDTTGRLRSHTDFGGTLYAYSYNNAGQLIAQSSNRGQSLVQEYYANGALKRITDKSQKAETYYEIDTAGNRTRERFTKANVMHQDNRITFDNAGRIITVQDNRYTLTYGYDANGNRRFNRASYYDVAGVRRRIENWYQYDSMDRVTLSQGVLANGKIQTSATQGVALSYDAAGNRRSATSIVAGATVVETYNYDDNHRLTTTWRNGKLDASRAYDAAGRVVEQVSAAGSASARRVVSTYNIIGQLTGQTNYDSANVMQGGTSYTEYDRAGNLKKYQTTARYQYTNTYTVSYIKAGTGYRESVVAGTSTYFSPGATTTSYDVNGNIISVSDQFAGSKTRSFITDQAGHILKKTENGAVQYYFYVDGKPAGSTGATGASSADFDFNYTPVSAQYPATTPGSWVVNSGDTLRSISQAVFGDARLWYLIADANGLRSDAELVAG
ncbi:MAG: hypothetical protein Q7U14_15115, partial [Lacisediminimonas sp.]|nr:hypothetical protein [Lacisediminimonas sp.]